MGKFLRSVWSDIAGAAVAVGGALTITDLFHVITSGDIIGIVAGMIGGALIGAGRGAEEKPGGPQK